MTVYTSSTESDRANELWVAANLICPLARCGYRIGSVKTGASRIQITCQRNHRFSLTRTELARMAL